jgi:HEAT repeat protein
MHTPGYSRRILRLMEENDLAGLLALLRQPANPDQRGEAAQALGELGNFEATELLVRAAREDPEAQVRAAAQRALTAMFGSEAGSVSASYTGTAAHDPWLVEPKQSEAENMGAEPELTLSDIEIEGFVRVARYESSERLRLQAVHVLGRSSSPAATDVLAELALWGDSGKIRQAAHLALENIYGDASAEILENYRADALQEARDSGTEEQLLEKMELEYETSDEEDEEDSDDEDEYSEDDDLDEDEYEVDNELDEEDEDEAEEADPVAAPVANRAPGKSEPARTPSPYLNQPMQPLTEEIGFPWWRMGLGLAGVAVLLALLLSGR